MYTFNPIPDDPVNHVGFVLIVLCSIVCVIGSWLQSYDPEEWLTVFFIGTVVSLIAYFVSFHVTDQTTTTYKNEQVTAKFVGFQPEGYRERSGKSMVDRHYMYVVYRVDGNDIILQGQAGLEYPKTAILYKN